MLVCHAVHALVVSKYLFTLVPCSAYVDIVCWPFLHEALYWLLVGRNELVTIASYNLVRVFTYVYLEKRMKSFLYLQAAQHRHFVAMCSKLALIVWQSS